MAGSGEFKYKRGNTMKAVNKRKLFIIIPTLVLILSVCFVFVLNRNAKEDRLSEEQIAALREQYPICGSHPLISVRRLTLPEVKDASETFIYGEVVEDISTYTVTSSTGNATLDEKRKQNGIVDEFEFYEYTIEVISDTEGKREAGEKITIAANSDFKDYNPRLTDGMKVVVPVTADKKVPARNYYLVDGMYYVTEDGYAISAFREDTATAKSITSGLKVDELLKLLKK